MTKNYFNIYIYTYILFASILTSCCIFIDKVYILFQYGKTDG